jgi:His/Glu/Gln/Arg/opine family amino acid ABC transporter permease subunit
MELNLALVWEARGPLLDGTLVTLRVALFALAFSSVLGLVIAILRMSRFKLLSIPAFFYTQVFRGTALYILILWLYFGAPIVTGIRLPPFETAVLCLGLLNSAYMSEVYRGGLQAIGGGQREAARAVGLNSAQIFAYIILPQALRIVVPAAANLFVDMLKDAAIIGVVGVFDLMRTVDRLTKFYFRPFEFYTAAAFIYLVLVFCFTRVAYFLERRLSGGYVQA